jgi:hypothetical protein
VWNATCVKRFTHEGSVSWSLDALEVRIPLTGWDYYYAWQDDGQNERRRRRRRQLSSTSCLDVHLFWPPVPLGPDTDASVLARPIQPLFRDIQQENVRMYCRIKVPESADAWMLIEDVQAVALPPSSDDAWVTQWFWSCDGVQYPMGPQWTVPREILSELKAARVRRNTTVLRENFPSLCIQRVEVQLETNSPDLQWYQWTSVFVFH